ncbi:MAG TPA: hypothetical protein VHE99_05900 [Gammaproteobacteria bacterium]|nr:hypothetical protein [Gammaproteobacteria bacterium]
MTTLERKETKIKEALVRTEQVEKQESLDRVIGITDKHVKNEAGSETSKPNVDIEEKAKSQLDQISQKDISSLMKSIKNNSNKKFAIELPSGAIHSGLIEAMQDMPAERLDLDSSVKINGLFSRGFAVCFAIIMKGRDGRRFSLAHVGSLEDDEDDVEFIQNEADFVSRNGEIDYSIELAICRTGYEEVRDKEYEPKAEQYFAESINEYNKIFRHYLQKVPTKIHEIPESSVLILDKTGQVITFEGYKEDQIKFIQVSSGSVSDSKLLEAKIEVLTQPEQQQQSVPMPSSQLGFFPPPPPSPPPLQKIIQKRKLQDLEDDPSSLKQILKNG